MLYCVYLCSKCQSSKFLFVPGLTTWEGFPLHSRELRRLLLSLANLSPPTAASSPSHSCTHRRSPLLFLTHPRTRCRFLLSLTHLLPSHPHPRTHRASCGGEVRVCSLLSSRMVGQLWTRSNGGDCRDKVATSREYSFSFHSCG
jgi:hypothetical protein